MLRNSRWVCWGGALVLIWATGVWAQAGIAPSAPKPLVSTANNSHTIQTNLGKNNSYDTTTGYFVDGSDFNNQVLAVAFTPAKAAHFAYALLPFSVYASSGGGSPTVVLMNDSGGLPNRVIDRLKQVGTVPDWPKSQVMKYKCSKCPALKKATRYWITAYETVSSVQIAWMINSTGDVSDSDLAYNEHVLPIPPWTLDDGVTNPAFLVAGTR
jgi:hypothetical protein